MATATGVGSAVPRGPELLRNARFNRGTAFMLEERRALGLNGLLPSGVQTLEQQSAPAYEQYRVENFVAVVQRGEKLVLREVARLRRSTARVRQKV